MQGCLYFGRPSKMPSEKPSQGTFDAPLALACEYCLDMYISDICIYSYIYIHICLIVFRACQATPCPWPSIHAGLHHRALMFPCIMQNIALKPFLFARKNHLESCISSCYVKHALVACIARDTSCMFPTK